VPERRESVLDAEGPPHTADRVERSKKQAYDHARDVYRRLINETASDAENR